MSSPVTSLVDQATLERKLPFRWRRRARLPVTGLTPIVSPLAANAHVAVARDLASRLWVLLRHDPATGPGARTEWRAVRLAGREDDLGDVRKAARVEDRQSDELRNDHPFAQVGHRGHLPYAQHTPLLVSDPDGTRCTLAWDRPLARPTRRARRSVPSANGQRRCVSRMIIEHGGRTQRTLPAARRAAIVSRWLGGSLTADRGDQPADARVPLSAPSASTIELGAQFFTETLTCSPDGACDTAVTARADKLPSGCG